MQIHEYPSIPQAPADADVLAIEVNGITYKVSKAVLAAAIIDKLGGDPVTVAHGGTGASTAANARTNLSVYSKAETDAAIAQATAYVTEYVNIGAEDMLAKIAQMSADTMIYFRTTSTTSNQPSTGMYMIGHAIRGGTNNITIQASEMSKPELIYQNSSIDGGTSWIGWKKYRSDYKYYYAGAICSSSATSSGDVFSYFTDIPNGGYLLTLYRPGYAWDDSASVYIVQHGSTSSVYGKVTIKEGSNGNCPKLNSSGKVTLSAASEYGIGISLIKLN